MTLFDLVIRSATVVTDDWRQIADIAVVNGRIAQIGGTMEGHREIGASGLFALPGGVDPHVHLTNSLPTPLPEEQCWVDDFDSGSQAAMAGGITTVGNMTFASSQSTMIDAVRAAEVLVAHQASADVLLHPVLAPFYAGSTADLSQLVRDGHRSLKVFMSFPEFDRNFEEYRRMIRLAAALDTIVLLHCEDADVIHRCTAALVQQGCDLQHFADSRPPLAEVTAVRRAIALCQETGARIYVVHLSCAEALSACDEARRSGLPIYVESRPLYLHLTSDRYRSANAGLYVGIPPLRDQTDIEALWDGIGRGSIDTLGSDHAPFTCAQKLDPNHRLQDPLAGVPELETMLPLLLSVGVHQRHLPLERLVALTASNPARLFGIYPRKGTIAVGSDADLALWDFGVTRMIDGSKFRSRAGYSPYDGMIAAAWPRITIRRGEVVFEEGEILATPGSGQTLTRGPTLAPRR